MLLLAKIILAVAGHVVDNAVEAAANELQDVQHICDFNSGKHTIKQHCVTTASEPQALRAAATTAAEQ